VNDVPHIVILSFWATYCEPCQKEIPELMKFAEKHKDDPIKIFCISLDKEGASKVVPFVKEKKYTLPMLLDPYKRTSERYGVKKLPALFVIGPDGAVRYSSSGYDDKQSLVDKLDTIVSGIREGKEIDVEAEDAGAESVPVVENTSAGESITPRKKWNAVARKECGENPEAIAGELGVSVDELKAWYQELKEAAMATWSDKEEQ
ncbi:MAG: redoxin domain-containing protein, partial [Chitinivibrionales bacterium]|nr:redoxin domain-containing protein [Chitinivibrionales bacterium]